MPALVPFFLRIHAPPAASGFGFGFGFAPWRTSSCENSDWTQICSAFRTHIDFSRQPRPPHSPIFYAKPKLNGGHNDSDKKKTGCTNHIYNFVSETIVSAFLERNVMQFGYI